MKLSRSGYLIAGAALLAALGFGLWKPWAPDSPSAGSKLPAVSEKPRSRPVSPSSQPEENAPAVRSRTSEEKKDLEQINEWLADESVTPEVAANKLWKLAADPTHSEAVREEALAHAMNLTDDETFKSVVLPLLGKKGLWPEPLGEKILDDLYNRPDDLKMQGTVALFQNSTGELHTNVRELLTFELGDPEAENVSDTELIRRANERMKASPD